MEAALARASELLDQAQRLLCEADRLASASRGGKASLYIQGARGSLRLAGEIVSRRSRERLPVETLGFSLVAENPARCTGRRAPLEGVDPAAPGPLPDFEQQPRPPVGCLGVDLFGSDRVRNLASGPVFAALLASALGRHEWMSLKGGARWQPDDAVAARLVSILGGGRPVETLSSSVTGGLVDRAVADELGALGWRLLRSPTI